MKAPVRTLAPLALAVAAAAEAAPTFVNGLTLHAETLDASGGTAVNDGRLGFFSDCDDGPDHATVEHRRRQVRLA